MLWVCAKSLSSVSATVRKRELSEVQKLLCLPDYKLKTECSTRWRSRQAMVGRMLEQQAAIIHVLSSDRKARHLLPTWQDLEVLEAVDKTLTPLADFTDALSGEQYVSISSVKPALHLFQSSVLAVKEDDSDLICTIKSKIVRYLEEKYNDQKTQDLDTATTLDPRFKMTYVNEDNKTAVQNKLQDETSKLTTVEVNLAIYFLCITMYCD
ncbi:hypothetical protein QQF64_035844 [Cirrhinus molitorella]|uniref:Zinc finger BED domain-containing 1-like protein n=1 Tax=Cirrhinus molitorella TaxID=172907 RepID=A0ABR3NGX1_9TELE